jgi:uncharacterized protein
MATRERTSLHAAIRQANDNNRARLVAGYCWNWASKRNPDLSDIVIPEHGYAAHWNLASEGNTWILSPTGVEEVGIRERSRCGGERSTTAINSMHLHQ